MTNLINTVGLSAATFSYTSLKKNCNVSARRLRLGQRSRRKNLCTVKPQFNVRHCSGSFQKSPWFQSRKNGTPQRNPIMTHNISRPLGMLVLRFDRKNNRWRNSLKVVERNPVLSGQSSMQNHNFHQIGQSVLPSDILFPDVKVVQPIWCSSWFPECDVAGNRLRLRAMVTGITRSQLSMEPLPNRTPAWTPWSYISRFGPPYLFVH